MKTEIVHIVIDNTPGTITALDNVWLVTFPDGKTRQFSQHTVSLDTRLKDVDARLKAYVILTMPRHIAEVHNLQAYIQEPVEMSDEITVPIPTLDILSGAPDTYRMTRLFTTFLIVIVTFSFTTVACLITAGAVNWLLVTIGSMVAGAAFYVYDAMKEARQL